MCTLLLLLLFFIVKSSTGRENNYCHYVILRSTDFAITKLNCSIVITTNSAKNGLLLYIIDATLESGPPAASQFMIARIAISYTPHYTSWTRTQLGIRGTVDYPRHTTTLLDAFNALLPTSVCVRLPTFLYTLIYPVYKWYIRWYITLFTATLYTAYIPGI
jgi:hypothetical protein